MLRKILSQILHEGFIHYRDIAKNLNIPEGLVEQMVWELERLGYLKAVMQGCASGGCAACPMKCGVKQPIQKAFALTSKGKDFLEREVV
jgi:DNA-binding IscR family transcriptional regulator